MNTQSDWLTTATIHDPERAALWGSIFPGARVPILSIIPATFNLPGLPGARVYLLDLEAITDDQCAQLVTALAAHFNLSEDEVLQELPNGVPILAEDVSLESRDQAMMTALMDGFDETGHALPGWEYGDPADEDPALVGTGDWDACDCDLCLAARGELDDDDDLPGPDFVMRCNGG